MIPHSLNKKDFIKNLVFIHGRRIFPYTLYVFGTKHEFGYKKGSKITLNLESSYQNLIEEVEFENLTFLQKKFLIQELDKRYNLYKTKQWTEFSSLLNRVNRHNLSTAPEEIKILFTKSNLKNVRTIIKQRHKEVCSKYISFKNSFLVEEKNIKKKKNQLTANQIVLLLQETGFFLHPKIEEAPKTKQAELISLITGLNNKNIKTYIEKLEKKVSVNGDNYQKDINKINKLLEDLTK